VGISIAAAMAFSGEDYFAWAGIFVFYAGLVVAVAALFFWAWGRPGRQAGVIIVVGALGIVALYFGGLFGLGGLHDVGRARNQMQRNELAEKEYLAGKAFKFINVSYDADKNQLIRAGPSSGEILNTAVVIPFGETYLLILVDSSAYVFDGTSSKRVEFTGKVVENGTAVTAGTLSFRLKNYAIDAIGLDWAEVKPGREKGGNEYGGNPKLVDAIAPVK
jgi:hypothetical protein